MYYFTSIDFLITLFGYLSSLDFNNQIENLTLLSKFSGAPYFQGGPLFSGGGALRQCLFCLQVAPALHMHSTSMQLGMSMHIMFFETWVFKFILKSAALNFR